MLCNANLQDYCAYYIHITHFLPSKRHYLGEVKMEATQELRQLLVVTVAELALSGRALDKLVQARADGQLLDETLKLLLTGVLCRPGPTLYRLASTLNPYPRQAEVHLLHPLFGNGDHHLHWGVPAYEENGRGYTVNI